MSSPLNFPQTWDASAYATHGRFVSDLGANILDWLHPVQGEEVLDIGCGDGALTEKILLRGAQVFGIDSSAQMVEAARKRGIHAEVMDATQMPFQQRFDAVFSNAALHWVRDQHALLSGTANALRPKGRFVAEMGGHGNIAAIRVALRAVLAHHHLEHLMAADNYFPTATEYRRLLAAHGFAVEAMELVPRPTLLSSGMAAWLRTFRRGVFDAIPQHLQETILDETVEYLAPALRDREGNWTADYVRLRFRARAGASS